MKATLFGERQLGSTLCSIAAGVCLAWPDASEGALVFNGTNHVHMNGGFLANQVLRAYTFEVWLKPTTLASVGGGPSVILFGGETFHSIPVGSRWLYLMPDGGLMWAVDSGGLWGSEAGAGSIRSGVWQHVCCSVNFGMALCFVDGTIVGWESVPDPVIFQYIDGGGIGQPYYGYMGHQFVGGEAWNNRIWDPGTNAYHGLMYGLRIWTRALSDAEVYALAWAGSGISTNGLCHALMFDEGTGYMVHDSISSLTGDGTGEWSPDKPPSLPRVFLDKGGFVRKGIYIGVHGPAAQPVALETSTDLVNWSQLQTNTLSSSGFYIFIDGTWRSSPQKFYRARLLQ